MNDPLIKYVDLPGLRKALEESGCAPPATLAQDVDQGLQLLRFRYKPVRHVPARRRFKNLGKVSHTLRAFFRGKQFAWGDHFIAVDEETVCGWPIDAYTPWPCPPQTPPDLVAEIAPAAAAMREGAGRRLTVKDIRAEFPKKQVLQHGEYEFISAQFVEQEVHFFPAQGWTSGENASSFRTRRWSDYLPAFRPELTIALVAGKILLYDDDFFVFSRRV